MKRFTIHWRGFCKDSRFDWYFCLACFVAALVMVVLIDAYVYSNLSRSIENKTAGDSVPSVTLNRANIDAMAAKLRAKDATPHIVPQSVLRDPSL